MLFHDASALATKHIQTILSSVILHNSSEQKAVVVFDSQSTLSNLLTAAYRRCLPTATFIDFDTISAEKVLQIFTTLMPHDLVVLIQSTSFRLEAFRIRVELFKKLLKVIEHPHLIRMQGKEVNYYIDSLAYDASYFRTVGHALKKRIDRAQSAVVDSGNEQLIFSSLLESAKLNIGDYSEMQNIGGQFPIGEVFTEARDLEAVQGRVRIFAFGDTAFSVNCPEKPITLIVEKGRIMNVLDVTPEFEMVLENIRMDEGEIWLRELGFGLNRAFSQKKIVSDIGTYERMCGIHLSLGAKHGIYKKTQFRRAITKHHVDVFAVTERVYLDDSIVYENGTWCV